MYDGTDSLAIDKVWAILHQRTRQPNRRITASAPSHGKRILRDVPLTFNSRTSRHRGRSTRCRRTKEGCAKPDPLWGNPVGGQPVHPLPREAIFLATPPQRAQSNTFHIVVECSRPCVRCVLCWLAFSLAPTLGSPRLRCGRDHFVRRLPSYYGSLTSRDRASSATAAHPCQRFAEALTGNRA
jgi:hypothetical protein